MSRRRRSEGRPAAARLLVGLPERHARRYFAAGAGAGAAGAAGLAVAAGAGPDASSSASGR